MQFTRDEIFNKIQGFMVELFEIDKEKITLESHLGDDLGLDSIDAIDLITELQHFAGKRLQPEDFRSVRTVKDVVEASEKILNEETESK